MPSIRYINQTAPFWDFVANLEDQGSSHPFFNAGRARDGEEGESSDQGQWPGWGGWANSAPPHWGWGRGRGGHRGGFPHRGPPGPPGAPGDVPAPAEKDGEQPPADGEAPPQYPADGPSDREDRRGHHHRRNCHGRRGGRQGMFGRGGPWGFGGPFGEFLRSQMLGDNGEAKEGAQEDFKPEADVFDTESAFVIHVSLPGAKKEDLGINWDTEKSELNIAGVVYRPGDEELLNTLAMDERKVGPFERKIRLGSRANPAQVDAESITAKLEEGILRVEVPKLDKDYVEIKKVDIE